MLLQPITAQLAWLAWCGTSYIGSYHPVDSSHFHLPLWREGEHSPAGQMHFFHLLKLFLFQAFKCAMWCIFVSVMCSMSHLTAVTLKVEVLVQSHHSDSLLAASGWNNGFITAHTQRGETPGIKETSVSLIITFTPNHQGQTGSSCVWRCLPVVILDTVWIVVVVGDERCPLKYAGAGAAAETVSVETLAHRLQDTVRDLLSTSGTHCQGILRGMRRNITTH